MGLRSIETIFYETSRPQTVQSSAFGNTQSEAIIYSLGITFDAVSEGIIVHCEWAGAVCGAGGLWPGLISN